MKLSVQYLCGISKEFASLYIFEQTFFGNLQKDHHQKTKNILPDGCHTSSTL